MDEAETYVQEILKASPKDIRFYQSIGTVYSTAGKYEKATEIYKKGLILDPNNPGPYLGMASLYAKAGKIDEAIKSYDKVLELKPDAAQTMKLYADLLRDNGKKSEALAMYKRSLEFLPTHSPSLFNAGILSAKLGDLDSAKVYLERLKSLDGELAKQLERFLRLKK